MFTTDLSFFPNISTKIATETHHHKSDATFGAVLQSYVDKIKVLATSFEELKLAFELLSARARECNSPNVTFKKSKIRKFSRSIESMKVTLLLALHNCNWYFTYSKAQNCSNG